MFLISGLILHFEARLYRVGRDISSNWQTFRVEKLVELLAVFWVLLIEGKAV